MATAIGQAIFGLLTNFSVSVTDIQGPAFLSPLAGQWVSNLSGLVTAKVAQVLHFSRAELIRSPGLIWLLDLRTVL